MSVKALFTDGGRVWFMREGGEVESGGDLDVKGSDTQRDLKVRKGRGVKRRDVGVWRETHTL